MNKFIKYYIISKYRKIWALLQINCYLLIKHQKFIIGWNILTVSEKYVNFRL